MKTARITSHGLHLASYWLSFWHSSNTFYDYPQKVFKFITITHYENDIRCKGKLYPFYALWKLNIQYSENNFCREPRELSPWPGKRCKHHNAAKIYSGSKGTWPYSWAIICRNNNDTSVNMRAAASHTEPYGYDTFGQGIWSMPLAASGPEKNRQHTFISKN